MESALIVLVSPADAEASGTAATVAALARALGPRAVVELRTAPDPVAEAARPTLRLSSCTGSRMAGVPT